MSTNGSVENSVSKSCVVFVLADGETRVAESKLAAAQQRALRQQVPFAVVGCLESWDINQLDRLRVQEKLLKSFAIPQIILINDRRAALAGFMHHTRPIEVLDGSITHSQKKLVLHPYAWPGVVLDIDGLTELHDQGKLAC